MMGRTMTQTEELVGALHVIASRDSPIDRQKDAVREVLGRFLREASETVAGDRGRIRSWLESVKLEVAAAGGHNLLLSCLNHPTRSS